GGPQASTPTGASRHPSGSGRERSEAWRCGRPAPAIGMIEASPMESRAVQRVGGECDRLQRRAIRRATRGPGSGGANLPRGRESESADLVLDVRDAGRAGGPDLAELERPALDPLE